MVLGDFSSASRASLQRKRSKVGAAPRPSELPRTPITTADFGRAVWERYTEALTLDEASGDQYAANMHDDMIGLTGADDQVGAASRA